jgi:hypothetical protein
MSCNGKFYGPRRPSSLRPGYDDNQGVGATKRRSKRARLASVATVAELALKMSVSGGCRRGSEFTTIQETPLKTA